MTLPLSNKFISIILITFFLVVLPLSIAIPGSDKNHTVKELRGPAFSDPSSVQEMPPDWIQQPIKYDSSSINADIVISLDQHLYPAILPLIQGYAREFEKKIIISEGTCGISAGMLSQKAADIAGFCCPPGETDRLPGLLFHTVGISAIALIVHPENPIDNITVKDAQHVYTGDIDRWSRLKTDKGIKGPNIPMKPVGRLHCKLRPGHWRLLLDNQDLFSTSMLEVGSIPDMINKVASNRYAIGYEVLSNLSRYSQKGDLKVLRINGHSPLDQEQLVLYNYPLYRVYNLTTWEGKNVFNTEAQKLVKYILRHTERFADKNNIIPSSRLRKAGWKFKEIELIGEPE